MGRVACLIRQKDIAARSQVQVVGRQSRLVEGCEGVCDGKLGPAHRQLQDAVPQVRKTGELQKSIGRRKVNIAVTVSRRSHASPPYGAPIAVVWLSGPPCLLQAHARGA